jgi:2-dehydro-3-deoxyphosphogluconate aldolase/(4S)-4-hydroxy-2-oxoglutarate aldolase
MSVDTGQLRIPFARLGRLRVVPVAVVADAATAAPLGEALKAGGLPCVEVTLRTPAAMKALSVLAEDRDLLVGAGTVTRAEQVGPAVLAGAQFVVSPGFSPSVVAACQELGIPVLPGAATATEVLMALDAGLNCVKFFPAEAAGGLPALSALSAPYGGVQFVPTGGITAESMPSYLAHPAVLAVGGSWMVPPRLLAAGRFDEVSRLTEAAVAAAHPQDAPSEREVARG